MKHNNYEIIVCGWSFGGAISILCCEDMYYRFKVKCNLITFGSPKCLFSKKCRDYVDSCCKIVLEFAHVNDIVPLVPFFNTSINKIKIGDKFSLFKLFKPNIYHCIYGDCNLYK